MKYKLYLRINEYQREGYSILAVAETEYDYWENHTDAKFVGAVDIDIEAQHQWLAEQSEEFAQSLEEELAAEVAEKRAAIAEFRSKFIALTYQPEIVE